MLLRGQGVGCSCSQAPRQQHHHQRQNAAAAAAVAASSHPLPQPGCTHQAPSLGSLSTVLWQLQQRRPGRIQASSAAASGTSSRQPSEQQQQQQAADAGGGSTAAASSSVLSDAGLLRRILSTNTAAEALDLLLGQQEQQQQMQQHAAPALSADDAELLLERALDAANPGLALSVYQQLCAAKRARAQGAGLGGSSSTWPAATLQHTETLIRGLCRQLRVADALATLGSIRSQGLLQPSDAEVSFGHVVSSPLPPQQSLAVVQPQEGTKVVADAASRYEFELFSGTVTAASSEALQPSGNPLLAAARLVGLSRSLPVAAVHELVITTPAGSSRTFRVGTASADVPAAKGERVTIVCAPSRGAATKQQRLVLTTSPPGTRPGQAMLLSNHATGVELPLLRPPLPGSQATAPSWLLPAVVLLAGSDAASGLLDPALPLLITSSLAAVAASAVASNTLLLPTLKKLPVNAVKLEGVRQQLLGQHARLASKVAATLQEASDDVRTLARLWQLQGKMQTVGGGGGSGLPASSSGSSSSDSAPSSSGGGGTYEARRERVAAVAAGIEGRLGKRLELLEGYARVMAMIEIEVEMELQIPVGELDGISVELGKLAELEAIEEEWQLQAEAQDEVEKLLRATPALLPPS